MWNVRITLGLDYVKDFLRELPASWDDTYFVDGFPGKFVVLARKLKNSWYMAGINGENIEKTLILKLPIPESVEKGILISDGADNRSFTMDEIIFHPGENLELKIKIRIGILDDALPNAFTLFLNPN